MKVASIAVAAGTLALLAGCTGVRVNEPVGGQNFYAGAFQYATHKNQEIDTVVLGSPFGPAQSDNIAALTTAAMKGATEGRTVTFRPASFKTAGDDNNHFRVVVLFNGKPPYISDDLCKDGPSIATAPGADRVTMDAAFCEGSSLISSADGTVSTLSGPKDPNFRELVRQVTHAMIPSVDKNELSNGPDVVTQ